MLEGVGMWCSFWCIEIKGQKEPNRRAGCEVLFGHFSASFRPICFEFAFDIHAASFSTRKFLVGFLSNDYSNGKVTAGLV